MKAKPGKRTLSLILALFLCLALLPTAATAADYNIWVNGERFTSDKLTITCGSGTATYDSGANTVTLTNATITASENVTIGDFTYAAGVGGTGVLRLNLVGENTLNVTGNAVGTVGIYAYDLYIQGEGSLTVNARQGIGAAYLTMDGGTVNVKASDVVDTDSFAVAVSERTTVTGGKLIAAAGNVGGEGYCNAIFLGNSTTLSVTGTGALYAKTGSSGADYRIGAVVRGSSSSGDEVSVVIGEDHEARIGAAGDGSGELTSLNPTDGMVTFANTTPYLEIVPPTCLMLPGQTVTLADSGTLYWKNATGNDGLTAEGASASDFDVSYDTATRTLTLNGFNYTGDGCFEWGRYGVMYNSYYLNKDNPLPLNIVVTGTNGMTLNDAPKPNDGWVNVRDTDEIGMEPSEGAVFSGDGTLSVTSGRSYIGPSKAIVVYGPLSFTETVTVNATAKGSGMEDRFGTSEEGSIAIEVYGYDYYDLEGSLTIAEGATVNATASAAYIGLGSIGVKTETVTSAGTLTATAGEVNLSGYSDLEDFEPGSYGICAKGDVTLTGGTVTATGGKTVRSSTYEGPAQTVTMTYGGPSAGLCTEGKVDVKTGASLTAVGAGDASTDYWTVSYGLIASDLESAGTVNAVGGDVGLGMSYGIMLGVEAGDADAEERSLSVSGGTLTATGGAGTYSLGVYFSHLGSFTVTGGSLFARTGTVTDGTYSIPGGPSQTIQGMAMAIADGSDNSDTPAVTVTMPTDYAARGSKVSGSEQDEVIAAEGPTASVSLEYRYVEIVPVTGDAGVSIIGAPTDAKTYGDAPFTLTANVTNAGTGTGAWTWTGSDDSVLSVEGTGAAATVTILKAGSAAISVHYESDTTSGDASTDEIIVSKATVTITAKSLSIYVNDTVPDLSSPENGTHYTVSGLKDGDALSGTLVLSYEKDGVTTAYEDVDATVPGSYDIVASGASVPSEENYVSEITYVNGTLSINNRPAPATVTRYTLTFVTNVGSEIESITDVKGESIDLSKYVPTRDGYIFAGWFSDEALTAPVDTVILNANTTVYAKWTEDGFKNPFIDVHEGSYYYDAVIWAVKNGVTEGTSADTFSPEESCLRCQIVTFLYRTYNKNN